MKYKEIKVKCHRKGFAGVMYTEPDPVHTDLPETYYTKSELEAPYMGTEREARKRYWQNSYQRGGSYGHD